MNKRTLLIVSGCCLMCMFAIFSYGIRHGGFQHIDFAFTVKLQEAIDKSPRLRLSRMVGEVMEGSTFFASPEVSAFAVLCLTFLSFFSLRFIDISKWGTWKSLMKAGIIPLLFLLLVLAEIYGKTVVHHPAPPFFMIKNPTTVFPKYYINDQFSYPSGHAARAVFIAVVAFSLSTFAKATADRQLSVFRIKKNTLMVGLPLIIYVGLVSVSRIYLGHHWLSDIIGGLALGGGMASIACAFFFRTDS